MQLRAAQYAHAWHHLLKDAQAAKRKTISRRMLEHLYHNNRLGMLPAILRIMEDIEYQESGVEPVTVRSAGKLTKADAEQLVQKILKKKGTAITQKIDPNLLGGIQIETKNSRWDVSLSSKLQSAYNRLTI
ncbi:hypothetical protein BK004_00400 [bacterium CG10_46_32]|nr:MAG: hypothetical protein BK004_00400 [bacterium CG10_46_32]PIR56579.1 MAG: hypothetical protein COU73_00395 [Parcubacteria group bacterium CG10_big_fil_rev_8_21_14_0_10_46_32]